MAKILNDDEMCRVYTDGRHLRIKTASGEDIPRIISISAEQELDYSRVGYCKVKVELWCKLEGCHK